MGTARSVDVFVDMCTQRDYLLTNSAQPTLNAVEIVPRIKHLMAFARWAHIPTLSCVDARRPADVRGLPHPHCVLGTVGQRKISFTVMPDHVRIDSDNCLCVSLDLLKQHQQAILAKEHRDPFTNPKLDRLLTEMPIRRFIVFGIALETSVRLLALGLLLRHRRVAVVQDACGYWNSEDGEMAQRQLVAKGCEMLTVNQLVESSLAHYKRNGHGNGNGNGQRRRRSVA